MGNEHPLINPALHGGLNHKYMRRCSPGRVVAYSEITTQSTFQIASHKQPFPLQEQSGNRAFLFLNFTRVSIALYATPEDVHTVSRNASRTKPAKFVVFFIKDEGAPILTHVHQLRTRAMYFPDETFLPKSNLPYVEARVNSKAAQLTENGAEIICLFARFALGASFISAVAYRFGLWGPYGARNVSWGDFAHFVEYTGAVMSLFPSSLTVSFARAATVAETLFGILLIAGFKIRMVSVLSGLLLLSFAMGTVTGLGIKTPFDYSVFSAAAAAFLPAFREPDRFTLDKLLNRSRN